MAVDDPQLVRTVESVCAASLSAVKRPVSSRKRRPPIIGMTSDCS
jgi:hypothetical protein